MVLIIKGLADNPLKLPERQQMEEEFEAKGNEEATQMLENTIYKIGVLL